MNTTGILAHDPETGIPSISTTSQGGLTTEFSTRYESRYYSEGRDSLDGDPIWINSIETGYKSLTAAIWYGNSPSVSYDELQLSLAATFTLDYFQISMGYTYLEFPFESADDHELGISLGTSQLPVGFNLGADIYYSLEAEGYFAELSLGREILSADHLSLSLNGLLGINQGYVADGHDGANHLGLMLEAELELRENLFLFLHSTYSWALDVDQSSAGDRQLIDFLHATAGLTFGF